MQQGTADLKKGVRDLSDRGVYRSLRAFAYQTGGGDRGLSGGSRGQSGAQRCAGILLRGVAFSGDV